jgi:hypothetical protein
MSDNNLDSILLGILGEKKQPEPDNTTIGDTVKFVPSAPAVAEPVAKPTERKLREPVDGKIEIEGGSNEMVKSTVLYSEKGYVVLNLHLKSQRIWGYGRGMKPVIIAMFGVVAGAALLAKLEAAGLRD